MIFIYDFHTTLLLFKLNPEMFSQPLSHYLQVAASGMQEYDPLV